MGIWVSGVQDKSNLFQLLPTLYNLLKLRIISNPPIILVLKADTIATNILYPLVDVVTGVAAGSTTIILSGAQAEADDVLTIEDATILVMAIPE